MRRGVCSLEFALLVACIFLFPVISAAQCFDDGTDILRPGNYSCKVEVKANEENGVGVALPPLTMGPLPVASKWTVGIELGYVKPALSGLSKNVALMSLRSESIADQVAECALNTTNIDDFDDFLASRRLILIEQDLVADQHSYMEQRDVAYLTGQFEPNETLHLHLLGCNTELVEVEILVQVRSTTETDDYFCARGRETLEDSTTLSEEPCLGRGSCDHSTGRCVCDPDFFGWACQIESMGFDFPLVVSSSEDGAEDEYENDDEDQFGNESGPVDASANETTLELSLAPGEWTLLSQIIGNGTKEDRAALRLATSDISDANIMFVVLRKDIIPQEKSLFDDAATFYAINRSSTRDCVEFSERASIALYNWSPSTTESVDFTFTISAAINCPLSIPFLNVLLPTVGAVFAFCLLVSVSIVLTRAGLIGRRNKNMRIRSLTPKEIDERLPHHSYCTPDRILDAPEKCSICLSDFETNDRVRKLPCEHTYHMDCVDPWVCKHLTCPDCRSPFEPPSHKESLKQRIFSLTLRRQDNRTPPQRRNINTDQFV